jgi:hypothetical protein
MNCAAQTLPAKSTGWLLMKQHVMLASACVASPYVTTINKPKGLNVNTENGRFVAVLFLSFLILAQSAPSNMCLT